MSARRSVPLWVALLVVVLGLVVGAGASLVDLGSDVRTSTMRLTMRLTELPATLRGHAVTATTMSPGGVVALGAENGEIALVDSRRGTSPSAWHRGSGSNDVSKLMFSADGASLAIANWDGAVDTLHRGELRTWRSAGGSGSVVAGISADGEHLAFSDGFSISVYDTRTGAAEAVTDEAPLPAEGTRSSYQSLGFTDFGRTLIGASDAGLDFWRLPGGELDELVEPICGDLTTTWTSLVTCGAGGHVLVVDLNRRAAVADQTVSTSAEVTASCVTGDGTLVFAGTDDGVVTAWHRSTDQVVARTAVADRMITNLVVSKDTKHLLVTTNDGRSWLAELVR